MATRAIVAVGLGVVLSACANDQRPDTAGLATGSLSLAAARVTSEPIEAPQPQASGKKTMGDRVLTALALERVTGLKPDPARLLQ